MNAPDRYAPASAYRRCAKCRSRRLALVPIARGFIRKECLSCGSTGPFEVTPRDGGEAQA